MNDAQTKELVVRLVGLYVQLSEKARLSRASQGAVLGLSGSRWSQIIKDPSPDMPLSTFLRVRAGCYAIQQALESGKLPASSLRGKPQNDAVELLTQ